jgi:alcohol dehydrogenase (NADP+)
MPGPAPKRLSGLYTVTPAHIMGAASLLAKLSGIGNTLDKELGHYAIMFGKALDAEVWAISRSRDKEADARQMGAVSRRPPCRVIWK